MLRYTSEPVEFLGAFFVWKKGRQKMRMITDARPTNQRLLPPPRVDLSTAEGLSRLEVAVDGD
eukprot:1983275-Pyramimonas_sp.AAC.1